LRRTVSPLYWAPRVATGLEVVKTPDGQW